MAISLTAVLVMAGAVAVGAVVKGLSRLETSSAVASRGNPGVTALCHSKRNTIPHEDHVPWIQFVFSIPMGDRYMARKDPDHLVPFLRPVAAF